MADNEQPFTGKPAPAFQVRRFKKNLGIDLNEPMTRELLHVLKDTHEDCGLEPCVHSLMTNLEATLYDGYQPQTAPPQQRAS